MPEKEEMEEEDRPSSIEEFLSVIRSRFDEMTDAIYGIVATLLVIDIHVPKLKQDVSNTELWSSITQLFPHILLWIMSFMTILYLWAGNHRLFKTIKFLPHDVFTTSLFMLMALSAIPFSTAVAGNYPHNSLAVSIFGWNMALYSLFSTLLRYRISKHPEIIIQSLCMESTYKAIFILLLFGPIAYTLAALISFLIHPYVAIFLYFVIGTFLPRVYIVGYVMKKLEKTGNFDS